MSFVLLALVCLLGVAAVLWMEARHRRDFHQRTVELHQERSRFWRTRLQADEPGADAAELGVRSHGHFRNVAALAETLRSRHREDAAETWVMGAEFSRELLEMEAALTSAGWNRQAAADRIRHAAGEIARARVSPAATPLRVVLVHGTVGAVLGGASAFLFVYRFADGFYLEDSAWPLVPWTFGAAVVGFMVGALGRDWAWTKLLPVHLQRQSAARLVLRAVAGVLVVVAVYAYWHGPPSAARKAAVLREMVARSGCPRPTPSVGRDSVPGLAAVERCAVVWTAASALPETPARHAFLQAGDTAGLAVASLTDIRSTNVVHPVPGWGVKLRNKFAWYVFFRLDDGPFVFYMVEVDQRTGRAYLVRTTNPRARGGS